MADAFAQLGIHIPEVLLPDKQVDLAKWSVVACDQYTAQPEYWEKVAALVSDAPSTWNLIYPEVYLGKEDSEARIRNIHRKMHEYLQNNILVPQEAGFVLVERRTSHALSRKGLIVALDLEYYDYQKGSRTLIRATEGTVLERIPPRVKIREEAPIELPHVMVLIDDPGHLVIEPLVAEISSLKQLYHTDLMMNGGQVTGYLVRERRLIDGIHKGLQALTDKEHYRQKYEILNDSLLLYAVGDGNHSLATAKAVWEHLKQNNATVDLRNHPARYAMVELVNIHDPGIQFEPIHRVVFHVNTDELLRAMDDYFQKRGCGFSYQSVANRQDLLQLLQQSQNKAAQSIEFVTAAGHGIITILNPLQNLAVGSLQSFLDDYLGKNHQAEVDYIHGAEITSDLGSKAGNMGFLLAPLQKNELFKTVIADGVLPRKTFSMGEAEEKRFYMECRKII